MATAPLRPFAGRPHNETPHRELKGFRILTAGANFRTPHVFVTTSSGEVEVYPLSDKGLLELAKQVNGMVDEHFKKYVEGK